MENKSKQKLFDSLEAVNTKNNANIILFCYFWNENLEKLKTLKNRNLEPGARRIFRIQETTCSTTN